MNAALTFENHLSDTESKWFAVHTRYKSEKMALKFLIANDINAYLPIKNINRRYGKRLRAVEMPLINSCIFVKIKKSEYVKVLETPYTAGFFKIGRNSDQILIITTAFIRNPPAMTPIAS